MKFYNVGKKGEVENSKMATAGVSAGKMPQKSSNSNSFINASGGKSLITFIVLFLAWVTGFASRLFAVIRFESIIHEFDPW